MKAVTVYAWLSRVCFATGVILLVVSACLYIDSLPQPDVTIDEPERTLSDVETGKPLTLTFTLNNPRRDTIRIVGLPEC
jgi:hypothetical protein